MPNKKIVTAVVLMMVILALASFKMYYIRDDSGVDILWNKSEGYLFLSVVRRGYHFSYIEYPMVAMQQYLGSIRRSPSLDHGAPSNTVCGSTSCSGGHLT
jgi:hypothetical protein